MMFRLVQVSTVAIAVLVGCGSSGGNAGTDASSYPTCQGATGSSGAGSPACSSCLQANCGSQSSAVETSCGAYLTCYEGCQCSDTACLSGCQSAIDSGCQGVFTTLTTCLSQSCASQCN